MKKHKYLNKSQKILLAAMTIPLVVSVLPVTENVHANNEIPTLRIHELNGSPKLEWATEILAENILWQSSFEDGQFAPSIDNGQFDYLHSFQDKDAYNGQNSYGLNDNSNGKGNYFHYPATSSSTHIVSFSRFYFENGTPLSLSFKAKSKNGQSSINFFGDGGWEEKIKYYKAKLTKKHYTGENVLHLTDVNELYTGGYLFLHDTEDNVARYVYQIKEIDYQNKTVTLFSPLLFDIDVSEGVKYRDWAAGFSFGGRTIGNNDWQIYNINTFVPDNPYYDVMKSGGYLMFTAETTSKLNVDDVQFGYATEVDVYREGQSIYKGYLSDFHDTTIRDNVKPNKVTTINSSITNDFNAKLNILKPEDNGVKANYQIQSISKSGTRSALSTPQEFEVKSGVTKYKYSISNKEIGTLSIDTNSLNDIIIPLKSINLENDYIHIQAIDSNGNASEVSSFKLNELIDMQDLYDKIKELENSNSYEDFIDFVDEIEKIYGDNLPQDLKEMIDKLGKYHGVNTSFLLLEEGDFRLSTVDINSFGHTKLTAKKQTLTTAFKGDFGVIDARGTQEGWNVTVSATPFTVETFDGFIGSPHQLPVGSLALNGVNHVEQVGTVHNSQLPDITLNQLTAIDGQNTTINLLNADKQKGMGEFQFTFGEDALALTVDAVTAKIDTVNYPDQNTPYASTVTWDLVSGPQI